MFTASEILVNSQFATTTNHKTICDFRRARLRGLIGKFWAIIMCRANCLMNVNTITKGKSIRTRHYAGAQTVSIDQIKGSEGRCHDFDQDFNPLKTHNQNRWTSIANAWQRGIYLPAVDLIKIGDEYVVRDGHHRISVAKFMGCNFVDAKVTEWVLSE